MRYFNLALLMVLSLNVGAHAAEVSWPPCTTAAVAVATPTPTATGTAGEITSTSLPSKVERCAFKPGLALEYRNDVGARWVVTFLGYQDDPSPYCVDNPPCAEWREDGDFGRWFYFLDGDNNQYASYKADDRTNRRVSNANPDPRRAKQMRWPLTIGDEWTNDFGTGLGTHRVVKVVGWERIRVPAGSFQVIHIQLTNNVIQDQRYSYSKDLYYEPNMGIFVKWYSGGFPRAVTSELMAIHSKP